MSQYSHNLAEAIIRALENVPSAQPAQVAGYWANRAFFLQEFGHYLQVANGYDERVKRMRVAYERYVQEHGGPHNVDEFGTPMQQIVKTSSAAERRKMGSEVRTALKQLAERALNLKIATIAEYDEFLAGLKVE